MKLLEGRKLFDGPFHGVGLAGAHGGPGSSVLCDVWGHKSEMADWSLTPMP